MQVEDIIMLMDKMRESGLSRLELEHEGFRLQLEGPAMEAAQPIVPGGAEVSAPSPVPGETEMKPADAASEQPGHLVTSPVVGVYYASPSPDSEPFVQVGSEVKSGETLCIIEAMKLMNEVTTDREGKILEIMVEDGQRVEYGQPLMRIGGAHNAT